MISQEQEYLAVPLWRVRLLARAISDRLHALERVGCLQETVRLAEELEEAVDGLEGAVVLPPGGTP